MITLEVGRASTALIGSAPLSGVTLGQYQVGARIGGGGMGAVYKAHDRRLDRWVALKFLARDLERDDTARERFLMEARMASAASHRHVSTIHGIEATDDGRLFIVMGYCEGQTLKERLKKAPITVIDALQLAGQTAEGLVHIHSKGIVHCDIKPSNLMVTEDGIKILDFGLAQWGSASVTTLSASTSPGTPAYAAPEQARGEIVDVRTDIWAVGVVLYEMLAGRPPFSGEYPEAISYSIRHDPPASLRDSDRTIPPEVESLVLKALEKDPNSRFQTATELAGELRRVEATIRQDNRFPFGPIGLPSLVGKTVSHYRITGKLGIGGMGVVYEARDLRLSCRVALKFASEENLDADAVRRLEREADTIAQLNNRHICTVYGTTEHEGRPCIVMERLEGMNLKQHMLKKPLETSEIVDIAVQITEALKAAHAVGIVHRDIKPSNIFVDKHGFVKVLDFGLARRLRLDAIDEGAEQCSTIPGRPIGTVNYMAPERIRQTSVDTRTDLFSLGVVIYEMATERLPFAASSSAETASNILDHDPVPLRELSPARPARLQRIVNRLLAKEPARRYQSAAALDRALRGLKLVKRVNGQLADLAEAMRAS